MSFLIDLQDIVKDLVRALFAKTPVDQGFRVSVDGCKRRFQFMRYSRYEKPSLLFLPGRLRHVFEHNDPAAYGGLREERLAKMELDDPVSDLDTRGHGFELLAFRHVVLGFRRSRLWKKILIKTKLDQYVLILHELGNEVGKRLRELFDTKFFKTRPIIKKKHSALGKCDNAHLDDIQHRVRNAVGCIQKLQFSLGVMYRETQKVIDKQT